MKSRTFRKHVLAVTEFRLITGKTRLKVRQSSGWTQPAFALPGGRRKAILRLAPPPPPLTILEMFHKNNHCTFKKNLFFLVF